MPSPAAMSAPRRIGCDGDASRAAASFRGDALSADLPRGAPLLASFGPDPGHESAVHATRLGVAVALEDRRRQRRRDAAGVRLSGQADAGCDADLAEPAADRRDRSLPARLAAAPAPADVDLIDARLYGRKTGARLPDEALPSGPAAFRPLP